MEYYDRELRFLYKIAAEFASRYPGLASRWRLGPENCQDPHVRSILDGFALLAARIHHRLDDDFPDITQAILNITYPQYMRPVPSMAVVEFELDPDRNDDAGTFIPKGSVLDSKPDKGLPCKFRTCYEVALSPIIVESGVWL